MKHKPFIYLFLFIYLFIYLFILYLKRETRIEEYQKVKEFDQNLILCLAKKLCVSLLRNDNHYMDSPAGP